MFAVCGEALYDLFAHDGPQGLAFDARIGGSPFNVALGLARLGQKVGLLTGLSTDPLGQRLAAAMRREGIADRLLVRTPRPTTISLVDLGPDGAPAYSFHGDGAADRSLTPADLAPLGEQVWGLHFGSYSLVAEPVGATLLGLARREARRRLISLDPNVRLAVEPDLGLWRARIDAFAATADLIKVSAEDLNLLWPDVPPEHVADRWLAAGAVLVVVTAGAAGASAYSPAGRTTVQGVPVTVADTVGAGDSFQAALIAGLAETGHADRTRLAGFDHRALAGLLGFAARAAAITCGRRGADLPRRAELPALSKEPV